MSSKMQDFLSFIPLFSGKFMFKSLIYWDPPTSLSLCHFLQPFNFDLPSDSHPSKVKGAGRMTLGKNEILLNSVWGSQGVDKNLALISQSIAR